MKNCFLFFYFIIISYQSIAQNIRQDRIVLIDNNSIECEISSITKDSIIYYVDKIKHLVDRSDVNAIIYKDNTIVNFEKIRNSSKRLDLDKKDVFGSTLYSERNSKSVLKNLSFTFPVSSRELKTKNLKGLNIVESEYPNAIYYKDEYGKWYEIEILAKLYHFRIKKTSENYYELYNISMGLEFNYNDKLLGFESLSSLRAVSFGMHEHNTHNADDMRFEFDNASRLEPFKIESTRIQPSIEVTNLIYEEGGKTHTIDIRTARSRVYRYGPTQYITFKLSLDFN